MAVLAAAAGVLVAAGCTPASGTPSGKIALDNFCTLEVRVEPTGKSIVAVREYGVLWVDKQWTGTSESQGCGLWTIMGMEVQTTEGTATCVAYDPVGGGGAIPHCGGYSPDWYQLVEPGDLVAARVGLCHHAGSAAVECDYGYTGGGRSVYP